MYAPPVYSSLPNTRHGNFRSISRSSLPPSTLFRLRQKMQFCPVLLRVHRIILQPLNWRDGPRRLPHVFLHSGRGYGIPQATARR